MVNPSPQNIVKAVYELYGYSFCQRFPVDIEENKPHGLFKLLFASLLYGFYADWRVMLKAYEIFDRRAWTAPEILETTLPADRLAALGEAGYVRDGRDLSRFLGDLPAIVVGRYNRDLRNLREHAGRVPEKERRLIEEVPGIDDVGADFFFQEVQLAWGEVYPFVGRMALRGARKLGLAPDARVLTEVIERRDFPRFGASLLQMEQDGAAERVLREARAFEQFVEM